jgi:hypothetical protein
MDERHGPGVDTATVMDMQTSLAIVGLASGHETGDQQRTEGAADPEPNQKIHHATSTDRSADFSAVHECDEVFGRAPGAAIAGSPQS